jgi:predicted house-cleaning noncanonical NTP pyrophosphatase (MazG superfamily)
MSEKLVRDNIISIMRAEGKEPKFRRLQDYDPKIVEFVTDKLKEELQEVLTSPGAHHLTEELGDLLTVMQKYAEINGIRWDDVLAAQHGKNVIKGRFSGNVILENVEDLCGKK